MDRNSASSLGAILRISGTSAEQTVGAPEMGIQRFTPQQSWGSGLGKDSPGRGAAQDGSKGHPSPQGGASRLLVLITPPHLQGSEPLLRGTDAELGTVSLYKCAI